MEIPFPLEFVVPGTPVSSQRGDARARNAWKDLVRASGKAKLPDVHFLTDQRLAVTLYYFPRDRMAGDVDNIIKLTLDALSRYIYLDDHQIERVVVLQQSVGDARNLSVGCQARALYTTVERSFRGAWPMNSAHEVKRELIKAAARKLEAQGYEIIVEPPGTLVPEPLARLRPDAIAIGRHPKWLIEVVREGTEDAERVADIQRLLRDEPEWKLQLVLDRASGPADLAIVAEADIKPMLQRALEVAKIDTRAALMLCWATLEALGRARRPEMFARPQSPDLVVEGLAAEGIVTPIEADFLRRMAQTRNEFVHGGLLRSVSDADLEHFVGLLGTILELAPA